MIKRYLCPRSDLGFPWLIIFMILENYICVINVEYGNWIYNYLRNQCLSPIKLWVRTLFVARCTWYNIISPRFLCRLTALIKLLVAVQRQSVLYTENSGFASPTLGQHISTFRIENCLKYNFIKLSCNWHVKSSAIYTPNAYEVICRVARMVE
jgi:hypothetical protein